MSEQTNKKQSAPTGLGAEATEGKIANVQSDYITKNEFAKKGGRE